MENYDKARLLINQERYVEAYDICPPIVHDKIMEEFIYIDMARQLWKELRYEDAAATLEAAIYKFPVSNQIKYLNDDIKADKATLYSFKQEKLSEISFHLDSISKTYFKKDKLKKIEIRGWVAALQEGCVLLVDQYGYETEEYCISIPRKDVVLHFSKNGLPEPVELCGFSFVADLSRTLIISLNTTQGKTPFVKITKETVLQALEGKDGWLFLDNDTNGAAKIFTGKIPATRAISSAWIDYSRMLKTEVDARNIKICIAISPSKEDVFPEYHPLKAASVSLVDTVVSSIFISGSVVSCPIRQLRQEPESYNKTDKHWSYLGAWLCTLDILELLRIQVPQLSPAFLDYDGLGDLGSKIEPPRTSIRKVWDLNNDTSTLIFDNKILGSGNIQVYENKEPYIEKSVMIFGSSSSGHLAMIMSNIFKRIVKLHTPATMPILEVIDMEKPEFVVIQSNSRFLAHTPKITNLVRDTILGSRPAEDFPPEWVV